MHCRFFFFLGKWLWTFQSSHCYFILLSPPFPFLRSPSLFPIPLLDHWHPATSLFPFSSIFLYLPPPSFPKESSPFPVSLFRLHVFCYPFTPFIIPQIPCLSSSSILTFLASVVTIGYSYLKILG